MLKLKHREEAFSPDTDEQRIREDERRRVMEELRGEGRATDDEDWRTTPLLTPDEALRAFDDARTVLNDTQDV